MSRTSRTTWAAAVLTAGLFAGSTGAAFADSPTSAPGSGSGAADLRTAATRDCALIKDLGPTVTDLLAIVNGDASTPGSVAWLNAGAAKAKAAGRANLASWLTTRATLRQEQGAVLQTRQQLLTTGTSWCQAHGFGAAA
ncbi:hypothetical protein ABIA35_002310 [Catenulispora sp. MAP12-49]|uniref:hypothetical protein n=1 Tax=unclassified Catenulispora TaxID=414885 RepID=UPI003519CE12